MERCPPRCSSARCILINVREEGTDDEEGSRDETKSSRKERERY